MTQINIKEECKIDEIIYQKGIILVDEDNHQWENLGLQEIKVKEQKVCGFDIYRFISSNKKFEDILNLSIFVSFKNLQKLRKLHFQHGNLTDENEVRLFQQSNDIFILNQKHEKPTQYAISIKKIIQEQRSQEAEQFEYQKIKKRRVCPKGGKRVKERSIKQVREKVQEWRRIYQDNQGKLTLDQVAKQIGISRKSLDDYSLQLRKAEQFGFDFKDSRRQKMGYLRKFVKNHTPAVEIKEDEEKDKDQDIKQQMDTLKTPPLFLNKNTKNSSEQTPSEEIQAAKNNTMKSEIRFDIQLNTWNNQEYTPAYSQQQYNDIDIFLISDKNFPSLNDFN